MVKTNFGPDAPLPTPNERMHWIDYGCDAVVSKLKQQASKQKVALSTADVAEKCVPHVIEHDEETASVQAGQQATFAPAAKPQTIWANLP